MAERRMLWKSISRSRKVNLYLKSWQSKIIYTWSIPHFDREGFMEADAATLKATVVPLINEITTENIDEFIMEIAKAGLWEIYENDKGDRFAKEIVFFDRQRIHPDEAKSQIINKIKGLKPLVLESHENLMRSHENIPKKKERIKRIKVKSNTQKIANEIYDDYPRKADRESSLKSIRKLLKAGVAKEELIQAQDNYRAFIEREQTESQYIIQSNNFFGQKQRWREFINPEMEEDDKALRDFEKFQKEVRTEKRPRKTGEN